MYYPLQIQAAIELLDQISLSDLPADAVANGFFRRRTYLGSKDRKTVSELTFKLLRNKNKLVWWAEKTQLPANSARAHMLLGLVIIFDLKEPDLDQMFTGLKYRPAKLTPREKKAIETIQKSSLEPADMPEAVKFNIQPWMLEKLKDVFGKDVYDHLKALDQPATLDLRINPLLTTRPKVMAEFSKLGWHAEETPYSPLGIRLERGKPLSQHHLFKKGMVEIQDEASQIASILSDAQPGMAVLDLCAGAGGKSLVLAANMQNKGRLVLTDTSLPRLSKAKERFRRAGVSNHEIRHLDNEGKKWLKRQTSRFDRVIADVPCSGSGTWRRNPDLKWRFSEKGLEELIQKQQEILDIAAPLIKPGGHLIYSTCSLFKEEDEQQIQHFLEKHSDFELIPLSNIWPQFFTSLYPGNQEMLKLTPFQQQTDGFFISILKRKV